MYDGTKIHYIVLPILVLAGKYYAALAMLLA